MRLPSPASAPAPEQREREMRSLTTRQQRNAHSSSPGPGIAEPWPLLSLPRWVRGEMANFDTLCLTPGNHARRSVLPSGSAQSTITEKWERRRESRFYFLTVSIPFWALRDDHGAGVHRRGCGSLSEHAGRRFLLRWQVGFAHGAQQHHRPLLFFFFFFLSAALRLEGTTGLPSPLLLTCLSVNTYKSLLCCCWL